MYPRVTVTVSIDTEEDNWQPARSGITVENIRQLPRLDRFCERLGVRATYFTSYQVAAVGWAGDIVRSIGATGDAEIGGHLHPWNTPPLDEPFIPRNTMTKNLAAELQAAKIERLTTTIESATGVQPVSFRTGRWGLGPETTAALVACGYRVDSSVTPFLSWEQYDDGPSYVGAPLGVYRIARRGDPRMPDAGGELVEVPISSGFTRAPQEFWARAHSLFSQAPWSRLRLVGLAARLGVVKRVVLSPEVDTVRDMVRLARRLVRSGSGHLHITWHSPTLVPGLTPFARTRADVDRLLDGVERLLGEVARFAEIHCATVRETAGLVPESVMSLT